MTCPDPKPPIPDEDPPVKPQGGGNGPPPED